MEEIIEQYLLEQLSNEEKKAFEQRIKKEPNLAGEVKIQREIIEAAKIQGLKAEISNTWHKVKFHKQLKFTVISTLVIALLSLGVYFLKSNQSIDKESNSIEVKNEFSIKNIGEANEQITDVNKKENLIQNEQLKEPSSITTEEILELKQNSIRVSQNLELEKYDSIQLINYIDSTYNDIDTSTTKKSESIKKLNNALISLVEDKYPEVYAEIIKEFDLTDSSLSTGVCEHLCNFKRATHIRVGNSEKTKDFPLEHSSKLAKRREVKELYKASYADCNCNCR